MDELCIFKLELSNDNHIPDDPQTPTNRYKSNINFTSEMLSVKYQLYKLKKQKEVPLNIVISHSPISSSPILTHIKSYIHTKLTK